MKDQRQKSDEQFHHVQSMATGDCWQLSTCLRSNTIDFPLYSHIFSVYNIWDTLGNSITISRYYFPCVFNVYNSVSWVNAFQIEFRIKRTSELTTIPNRKQNIYHYCRFEWCSLFCTISQRHSAYRFAIGGLRRTHRELCLLFNSIISFSPHFGFSIIDGFRSIWFRMIYSMD